MHSVEEIGPLFCFSLTRWGIHFMSACCLTLCSQLLQEACDSVNICLDDIINDIRAMGSEGAGRVSQSRQGTSGRQILLQTMEDILQVLQGKEMRQVGCRRGVQ